MTRVSPVRLLNSKGFHRNSRSPALALCVVALACWGTNVAALSAATYYVAPNGDNTNPGTIDAPWKSIQKAFNSLRPGDTALVRGGTYREYVSITTNGASGSPITIKNYPGETPVIDGSLPVTGWTRCQAGEPGLTCQGTTNPNYNSIYVAQINKSVAGSALDVALFENYDRLQMASDPDQSNPVYYETSEFRPLRNEGGNWGQTAYMVDSVALTQPDDYWNGAGVCIWSHGANNWVVETTVGDFIAGEHKIVFGQALSNALTEGSQPDAYVLVNHPLILNQPGEYYVVADTSTTYKVYLWPRNAADLTSGISVLDGQQSVAVFLASDTASGNYITIDGLTVRNSKTAFEWVRWAGSSSYKGITIKNCTVRSVSGSGFYMQYCDGAVIDNCRVNNVSGSFGIMFGMSSNCIVRNSIVDKTEQTGIYFGGDSHCQIIGNRVGSTGTHGNGITTYDNCADILVANNVVTTQHVSITLQNSSNLTYYNNILYNSGGGAKIASWGGITGRCVIANNVLLGGEGLYGDTSGCERIVFNNILEGTAFAATTHNNNIFVSAIGSYNSNEILQTDLTKIFVDPTNRNYHLSATSPARNYGTTVTSYLPTSTFPDFNFGLDAAGVARDATPDLGVYEDSSGGVADQAPVLNAIGPQQVTAGATLTLTLNATDADGGALTYSAASLPAGATLSGQTFTWTPANSQAGTHQVTFTVSDGQLQDSENVTITVAAAAPANTAPVLEAIANKTVLENATLTFTIQATDVDGDTLTYSATGLPTGATFSGQTFSWTPTYSQAGNYTVTFSASDGEAQTSKSVAIKVTNVNRKPKLNPVGNKSVTAGTALSLQLSATDPDGDALTYSATPIPTGASLSGNVLAWTPTANQVGVYDVTFAVSDGQDEDSAPGSIAVIDGGTDKTPPQIAKRSPDAGAIQVPLNNIISVTLTDMGAGIDPASVVLTVDGQIVYQGDVANYDSATGRAHRSGMANRYRYTYQADNPMPFDHTATVKVDAKDLAGNTMTGAEYSFVTQMMNFADSLAVNPSANQGPGGKSATVSNGHGYIWAVWQAGPVGKRHIYTACLPVGTESFNAPIRVATHDSDQCNPDIARGADGRLYAVWQDNQLGNWDIYLSVSNDGATWSLPVRVSDSDKNEINPAIAVDKNTPSHIYVTWEDDRNGNADIYVAEASDNLAQWQVTRVTSDTAAQTEPDIAVNGDGTAVIVWTDARNGATDIYGASSQSQTWVNVPLVTAAGAQSSPALAGDPSGTKMHLVWVDEASGNRDVFYASFDGMPGTPLTGVSVADDTAGADQIAPAVLCTNEARVFACWEDYRHTRQHNGDTDVFVSELTSGTPKTNVIVGDGGTNAAQSDPALGVDAYGNAYVIWTDARSGQGAIYYAGAMFTDPNPIQSVAVDPNGATVGTDPAAIASTSDVSVVVPAYACPDSIQLTISRIVNPKGGATDDLGSYDFGPSGVTFDLPVTVTIPYRVTAHTARVKPCWYDALTDSFSQQGITDVEDVTISSTLHALQFKTTHFTPYYVVPDDTATSASGSSGGGGCSLSIAGGGSPTELIIPVLIVALTLAWFRRRDIRKHQRLVMRAPTTERLDEFGI